MKKNYIKFIKKKIVGVIHCSKTLNLYTMNYVMAKKTQKYIKSKKKIVKTLKKFIFKKVQLLVFCKITKQKITCIII